MLTYEEFVVYMRNFNFIDERDSLRVKNMTSEDFRLKYNESKIDALIIKGEPVIVLICDNYKSSAGIYFDALMSKSYRDNFSLGLFRLTQIFARKVLNSSYYTAIRSDLDKALKFANAFGYKKIDGSSSSSFSLLKLAQ